MDRRRSSTPSNRTSGTERRAPGAVLPVFRVLAWALVACGIATPTRAATDGDGFHVRVSRLRLDGLVFFAKPADLDGDGTPELVVGYRADQAGASAGKTLACFDIGEGRRYGPRPTRHIRLPDATGVVDFGDANGDGRTDLVYTVDGSLWALFQGPDGQLGPTPHRLLTHPLLVPSAATRLFDLRLFRDLDGNGTTELVLPGVRGYLVFRRGKDGRLPAEPSARLPLDYVCEMQASAQHDTVLFRVPHPLSVDVQGDGHRDLVFSVGTHLRFFVFDPRSGSFGAPRLVDLPVTRRPDEYLRSHLGDVDGDGNLDLFLTRGPDTQVAPAVVSTLFRGRPGMTYRAEPDAVIHGDKQILPPDVLDLNGDGREELVTYTWKFGINALIDFFIRDQLILQVGVYEIRSGIPAEEPTVTRKVKLKMEEEEGNPAGVNGDFNGDGRRDIAYTPNSETLLYLLGDPEVFIPEAPDLRLDVRAYGQVRVRDLDGDGADDIYVIPVRESRRGELLVLISEKR